MGSRNRRCMVESDEEDVDRDLNKPPPSRTRGRPAKVLPSEAVYLPGDTSAFEPEGDDPFAEEKNQSSESSDEKRSTSRGQRRGPGRGRRRGRGVKRLVTTDRITGNKTNKKPCLPTKNNTKSNEVDEKEELPIPPPIIIKTEPGCDPLRSEVRVKQEPGLRAMKLPQVKLEKIDYRLRVRPAPVQAPPPPQAPPPAPAPAVVKTQDATLVQGDAQENREARVGGQAAALMPPPMKQGPEYLAGVRKSTYARTTTPVCDAIMKEYSKRQRVLKNTGTVGDPPDLSDLPIHNLIKNKNQEQGSEDIQHTNDRSRFTPTNMPQNATTNAGTNAQALISTTYNATTNSIQQKNKFIPISIKEEKIDVPIQQSTVDSSVYSTQRPMIRGSPWRRGRGRPALFNPDDDPDDPDDPGYVPQDHTPTHTRNTRLRARALQPQTAPNLNSSVKTVPRDPSKNKALSIAAQLKITADKIANLLKSNDLSANIGSEAQHLIKTTQELLAMQNQQQEADTNKISQSQSTIKIKQEPVDCESSAELHMIVPDHSDAEPLASNDGRDTCSPSLLNYLVQQCDELKDRLGQCLTSYIENPSQSAPSIYNKNPSTTAQEKPQRSKDKTDDAPLLTITDKTSFVLGYFSSYQEVFDDYMFSKVIPVLSELVLLCVENLNECLERTKNISGIMSKDLRLQEVELAKQTYLRVLHDCGSRFFPTFNEVISKMTKTKSSRPLVVTFIFFISASMFMRAQKYRKQMHNIRKMLLLMSKLHKIQHSEDTWGALECPDEIFNGQLKLLTQILEKFEKRRFTVTPVDKLLKFTNEMSDDGQSSVGVDLVPIPSPEMLDSSFCAEGDSLNPDSFAGLDTTPINPNKQMDEKIDNMLSVLRKDNQESSADGSGQNDSVNMLGNFFENDKSGLDSMLAPFNKSSNNRKWIKPEPVDETEVAPAAEEDQSAGALTSVRVKQEPVWTDNSQ